MKSEIKAKWLEALRSGKYKQGRIFLRRQNDEFCCLGVLCDLDEEIIWKPRVSHTYGAFHREHAIDDVALGKSYREKLEISRQQQDVLIGMNDEGKSFAEIADWIEENM